MTDYSMPGILQEYLELIKHHLDLKTEGIIQEIIDIEPDALLLIDTSQRIVLANSQAVELFGYSHKELLNLQIETLLPKRFNEIHKKHFAQFIRQPESRLMSARQNLHAIRRDGTEIPVDISLKPLFTTNRLVIACAIRDISERKRVELALQESEQIYRALFEHANDAIFLLNLDGVHVQVNQKSADLLGYTREELVGLGTRDIVASSEHAHTQDKKEALLNGKSLPLYERLFRKKDGTVFPVEINVSLIRDLAGKPKLIQSIVRDITERKNSEHQQLQLLEKYRQSREDLRALTARLQQVREDERRALAVELHDRVGQILTGLNMNLQIISHQFNLGVYESIDARIRDSVELVEQTSRLLRNVMADLRPPMLDDYGLLSALNWYRQDFSKRTNIPTNINGNDIQPRPDEYIEIALFRITQEALNNIAKHAKASRVDIYVSGTEKSICLNIIDDGIGFDPEGVSVLSQSPHWGLLTMKERAASINGELIIDSEPGKGTRILVQIER
jgi:PAS domain S-box-containing protein